MGTVVIDGSSTHISPRRWAAPLGFDEAGLCGRSLALADLFCITSHQFTVHI